MAACCSLYKKAAPGRAHLLSNKLHHASGYVWVWVAASPQLPLYSHDVLCPQPVKP